MPGYPEQLKYFMWPWQVYFRIGCQTSAESLFNQLDRGLKPYTFLVGFSIKNRDEILPVCIEPEEFHFSVDEFEGIQAIADELYDNDEGRNMLYSGDGMQEEMDGRLKRKTFRLAIEKILNKSAKNPGKIHFTSPYVVIENYCVFVILSLDKNVYTSQTYLHKVDPEEQMRIYYSLLETAKDSYLNAMMQSLCLPNAGKNLSSDSRPSLELLREASRNFMYTIAWAGKKGEGLHLLYDACNNISISRYEGSENNGHLIIATKDHPGIEMTLELDGPFQIRDYRKTRKILELSDESIGIVCNSLEVLGLGKVKPDYNIASESIFHIQFRGIHCWDVLHDKQILFQMRYGQPELSREIINKTSFFSDAKRLFPAVTDVQLNNLYFLSAVAVKQKKGAMLVFISDANEEATRLSKQCIAIKPVKLDEDLVINLTSIDGGLIIDLDGFVYAKGAILDGIVGLNGDAARGSRYNSALTYQEYRGLDKPTMVVVVSEDGMIDIIPELMPQIKHSEIRQVIEILEKLNSPSDFDTKTFYNAVEWLKNRRFYLNKEECEKINGLKNELEALDRKSGERTVWIVHEDLFPDPQMNDSYYYNEK